MLGFSSAIPAGGLLAVLLIVAVFAAVGWIIRHPNPRRRSPHAAAVAQHLVPLTATESVAEAERIAASLRARGVVALANAAERAPDPRRPRASGYSSFVVVAATDLDRANQLLIEDDVPEGPVPNEEIVAQLTAEAEAEADREADIDEPEDASATRPPPDRIGAMIDRISYWGIRIVVIAFGAAIAKAWLLG